MLLGQAPSGVHWWWTGELPVYFAFGVLGPNIPLFPNVLGLDDWFRFRFNEHSARWLPGIEQIHTSLSNSQNAAVSACRFAEKLWRLFTPKLMVEGTARWLHRESGCLLPCLGSISVFLFFVNVFCVLTCFDAEPADTRYQGKAGNLFEAISSAEVWETCLARRGYGSDVLLYFGFWLVSFIEYLYNISFYLMSFNICSYLVFFKVLLRLRGHAQAYFAACVMVLPNLLIRWVCMDCRYSTWNLDPSPDASPRTNRTASKASVYSESATQRFQAFSMFLYLAIQSFNSFSNLAGKWCLEKYLVHDLCGHEVVLWFCYGLLGICLLRRTGAYSSTESNCKAMLCNSAQFVQKVIQHCHRWSAHLRYFHHAIGRLMGDPLLTMAYGPLFFRNLVSVGAMGLYSKNIRQRPQRTAAVDAILAIS